MIKSVGERRKTRRSSGGSVRKRGRRWQALIGVVGTGTYRSLGTFQTRAEAELVLAEAKAAQSRGSWVDPQAGTMTVSEYVGDWIATNRKIRSPLTRDLYGSLLRNHITPQIGQVPLNKVTPKLVRDWHTERTEQASATTAAKAYRLLRAAYNTAVGDELVVRNPCRVEAGGQEHSEERPVATVPQVFALAHAMPDRLKVLPLIAMFGSLRFGECAGLQRRDVDPLGSKVHIRRQIQRLADGTITELPPKQSSARTVALPPQVMQTLVDHLDHHVATEAEALVFTTSSGGPMHRRHLSEKWRTACEVVRKSDRSLPDGLRFHDLRGTGATLATAQGASLVEVMARLGHSTTAAAMRYQHATADRDEAIAHLMGQAIDAAAADSVPFSRTGA